MATATVRVVIVPNIGQLVTVTPEFMGVMELAANGIADVAKGLAPVDEGEYRDSIEGHAEIENGFGTGIVSAAGDPPEQAIYLEFGTSDTPTFATLRRAAESFGL